MMKKNLIILFLFIICHCVYSRTVDVRDYGAVGDGIENNTFYFKKAISELNNNDTLYISKGSYVIDYFKIDNLSNIIITGGGELKASSSAAMYFFLINNCDSLNIDDLILNGSNISRVGVEIWDSSNVFFNSLEIFDFYGKDNNWSAGILIRSKNHNLKIMNSRIYNIKSDNNGAIGIYYFIKEAEVDNNQGILITKNLIENINSPLDADAIRLQNLKVKSEIVIQNNLIQNFGKRAIKIQTDNVKILNNRIYQYGNYGNAFSVISIYGSNVLVESNYFESFEDSSANMFSDISSVRNIALLDNTFIISDKAKAFVKDFINIKHHTYDDDDFSENINVKRNYVKNIRHFLFLNSNIFDSFLEENIVLDLRNALIGTSPDIKFNSIEIKTKKNSWNNGKYRMFITSNPSIKNVMIEEE
ncbi:glycosyl hydrolase family 28-related protein [Myroides odoratimimus]|uniref:glycosyl hydrolase family 28-related protein n=1 Tax=Myroides odoratimimus TaxID=76832 RepID=UPI003100D3D5